MSVSESKIILEVEEEHEVQHRNMKKMLAFCWGDETYCISITEAKETVFIPHFTKVPNTPSFVVGVMNLRGEIITILHLKQLLHLNESGGNNERRVVVTDVGGSSFGILVDSIEGTLDIASEDVQPPLATVDGELADCIQGQISMDGKIITLLSIEKIINCQSIKNIKKGD